MSMQGTHKARAKQWDLGHSDTGKEQIAVMFEITEGEHAGKHITWFGYFTDATIDRTFDSLRHMGWTSDNIAELDGLNTNEVEIVIEPEEYQGKWNDKVKWVNRPSRLALKNQMNDRDKAAFAARMKGKAMAHRQTYGGPRTQAASGPRSNGGGQRSSQQRMPTDGGYREDYQGSDDDIPF